MRNDTKERLGLFLSRRVFFPGSEKKIDPEKFGSKIRAKWGRDRNRQKAKDSKAQSLTGEGTQTAEEGDDDDADENSQVRGCLHVEST